MEGRRTVDVDEYDLQEKGQRTEAWAVARFEFRYSLSKNVSKLYHRSLCENIVPETEDRRTLDSS